MVSLLRCDGYNYENVKKSIEKSFELLGGIDKYIKSGTKVLLKVNLLLKKAPELAATTNHVFVEALAQTIIEAGGIVTIADSPGGPYTASILNGVYDVCGMKTVEAHTGAVLNYDTGYKTIHINDGVISRSFEVINPVFDNDIIISVAKIKTHQFTKYTGAVKNMFGVIPGVYKAEYHLRLPTVQQFCEMLIDLCECVKPTLAFIDGIVGMEGAGPSAGVPRKIGAVIASENPHDADVVATSLIGLGIDDVATLKLAKDRGLISDFDICGDEFDVINDYVIPNNDKPAGIFSRLPFLSKYFSARPKVVNKNCIGCGDCAKNCPAKAITMVERKPVFDYDKCFRCYCCQELCPKATIVVKRHKWLLR